MARWSIQPVTYKDGRCIGLQIVLKSGSLNLVEHTGPVKTSTWIPLPFRILYIYFISECCVLYGQYAVKYLNVKLCETINLYFALCGFETRYFTLRREDGLGLVDNMYLRKKFEHKRCRS